MKGKVAIAGMGCSASGALHGCGREDLLIDAGLQAIASAGIVPAEIEATWFGCTSTSSVSALVNYSLKLGYTSMTKVASEGATGAESLRAAYIAVASGVYDVVLVAGVEKLDDFGHPDTVDRDTLTTGAAPTGEEELVWECRDPVHHAMYVPRYCERAGLSIAGLRAVLAHIAARNRRHGTKNPLATLPPPPGATGSQPAAWPLTVADCAIGLDGAAAAIVCSVETARRLGANYVVVEGVGVAASGNEGRLSTRYGFDHIPETRLAAARAYAMAGITNPADEIDHAELFDITSSAELLAYEDLGLAPPGKGAEYARSGFFDLEGKVPVNTDGGLLANGFQPGATGIRQVYEAYVQLTGQAAARQLPNPRRSLVHTMGGTMGAFVSCVQILARPGI